MRTWNLAAGILDIGLGRKSAWLWIALAAGTLAIATPSAARAQDEGFPGEKPKPKEAPAGKEGGRPTVDPAAEQAYKDGVAALQKNDFKTAAEQFASAAKLQAEKSGQDGFFQAYLGAGIAYINLGDWEKAIPFLSRAVQLNENAWEGHAGLARAYYELKDYKTAAESANQSLGLVARQPETLYYLGRSNLELKELDSAAENFEAALAIARTDKRSHAGLGRTRLLLGEVDRAIASLQRAVELDKKDAKQDLHEAYYDLGRAYLQMGDRKKAITNITEATKINAKEYEIWLDLGNTHFQEKEFPAAIDAYARAIEVGPTKDKEETKFVGYLARGRAQLELSKTDIPQDAKDKALTSAQSDVDQVIELQPRTYAAFLLRGIAYRQQGKWKESIEAFNEVLSLNPNVGEAFFRRAIVWYEQGEYDIAQKDLDDAVQRDVNDPRAYLWRGIVKAKRGDHLDAINDYTNALRLRPSNPTIFHNRALAFISMKDYERAISDLNEAIRYDQTDATAYHRRGVALELRGDTEAARKSYDMATQLNAKLTPGR